MSGVMYSALQSSHFPQMSESLKQCLRQTPQLIPLKVSEVVMEVNQVGCGVGHSHVFQIVQTNEYSFGNTLQSIDTEISGENTVSRVMYGALQTSHCPQLSESLQQSLGYTSQSIIRKASDERRE